MQRIAANLSLSGGSGERGGIMNNGHVITVDILSPPSLPLSLSLSLSPSLALAHPHTCFLDFDSFDHIFWFGDLNYRVELTRDQADQYLANSDWMVSTNSACIQCIYIMLYFLLPYLFTVSIT